MRTRDLILLSGLNASLAFGLLGWSAELWNSEPTSLDVRQLAQWDPTDSFSSPQPDAVLASVTLSEALTRPIFQKSRRPFVATTVAVEPPSAPEAPAAAATPPPGIDSSQLTLKGLLLLPDHGRALIATAETPDGVWVEPGAHVSGWTVKSLDQQGVLLASGETEALLKLYVDKPPN